MRTSDFDYHLPPEQIAQTPAEPRDASRLLVLHRASGLIEHRIFRDIGAYLRPGDLLVANESRVIPARLFGEKSGDRWAGGSIAPAPHRRRGRHPGRRPAARRHGPVVGGAGPAGRSIRPAPACASPRRRAGRCWKLRWSGVRPSAGACSNSARRRVPGWSASAFCPCRPISNSRPPTRSATRRSTRNARLGGRADGGPPFHPAPAGRAAGQRGSASPPSRCTSASTPSARCRKMTRRTHPMHHEWYELGPAAAAAINATRAAGGRVVAVGTTSVRVLETAARDAGAGRPRPRDPGPPAAGPTCSSTPASASAWSMC